MEIKRIQGYKLNDNDKVVNAIMKRVSKCNGECPCTHTEWNEQTPAEDKQCPCITYRNGDGCHCGLYVKE